MNTKIKSGFYALPVIVCAMILWSSPAYSQQAENWAVGYDTNGQITNLTIENPRTDLNIEQAIRIETDPVGVPLKGTVKYKDGLVRKLDSLEMMVYFQKFNGPHLAWNSDNTHGYTESIDPSAQEIPDNFWGRASQVTTKADQEFYGILNQMNNNPQWFKLKIGLNLISFYRPAVSKIMQIKSGYEHGTMQPVTSAINENQ